MLVDMYSTPQMLMILNIKTIHDKWVVGVDGTNNDIQLTNLFNRFTFIDRAYTDIKDLFKLSPTGMVKSIVSATNVNFYNFIARLLSDNNFDFIPLPTFINYTDHKEVAKIFEPQTFNESLPSTGPQFICMYIGERSNKLDINEKYGVNKNDGWKVHTTCDNGSLKVVDSSTVPDDFTSSGSSIPYFLVKYGDQNQSVFKNIKLDQMEFTETDEGLQIIEDLGNKNRNNSVGQNLFDIYQNRSYSAEVDMLGCAQIQPFMYFQLDNVPMFTGAYTIINTRHTIKPNHMSTSFKGVRIRYGKTKMVDKHTLYLNLIGNLSDVTNEGVFYSDSKIKYISKSNQDKMDAGNLVKSEKITNLSISDPLKIGMFVTSDYGPRGSKFHEAIDLRAPKGTPIYPIFDSVISKIKYKIGDDSGLYIEITSSSDPSYKVWYMHLSDIPTTYLNGKSLEGTVQSFEIYPNKKVLTTNIIGYTGGVDGEQLSGSSRAEHLHLEILEDNIKKNPQRFFNKENWGWASGQDDNYEN